MQNPEVHQFSKHHTYLVNYLPFLRAQKRCFRWTPLNSQRKIIYTCGRDEPFSTNLFSSRANNMNDFSLCVLLVVIRVGLRLGEYDLNSEEDCSLNNSTVRCLDIPRDYAPSEFVLHSGFNPHDKTEFKNDIALIRLRTRVDFSGTLTYT
jgi:hypothetical protein